jgi:hypothetical protein
MRILEKFIIPASLADYWMLAVAVALSMKVAGASYRIVYG